MSSTNTMAGRIFMAIIAVPLAVVAADFILKLVIFRVLFFFFTPRIMEGMPINLIIYLRYTILAGIASWAALLAYVYVRHGDFKLDRLGFWKKGE